MAKEWVLNSVMNRFQLNFKKNVGATSDSIRKCSPKSQKEWAKYYYKKIRSQEHIDGLGETLYKKIHENILPEINSITEEDCKNYIHQLIIDRTYDGYARERDVIYGILEKSLGVDIHEAPDEWDRKYNVDYFILVGDQHIGLQIKPIPTGTQLPQIFKEHSIQKESHVAFTKKYGGKVFYVFSDKRNEEPFILNVEVESEIKEEIKRLT